MEPTDDPYVILGVPANATARDIRTAYRRLALEHHPDRNPGGGTNHNGERCRHTTLFAKINHAYEVLTDPEAQRSWAAASSTTPEPYPQQSQQQQRHPYYHHDPFSVFESVFREDFGRDFSFPRGTGGHHGMSPFSSSSFFSSFGGGRDPFDDPFFRRPNGPAAATGMMNHQHWPFSARGGGGLFPHNDNDDFFGRGMDDLFRSTWEDIARKHHHHSGGQPSSSSFYSSSTVSRRNSQGEWVTETTENRNGQVTTERVTHDARGNIVRSEMIENDDNGAGRRRQQLPADTSAVVPPVPKTNSQQHHNGTFRLPWQRRGGDE
jgi:curved DNA-binding protein CbpA